MKTLDCKGQKFDSALYNQLKIQVENPTEVNMPESVYEGLCDSAYTLRNYEVVPNPKPASAYQDGDITLYIGGDVLKVQGTNGEAMAVNYQ